MARSNARFAFLALFLMPLVSSGEPYCRPVSGDDIASGMSGQDVTMDTAECTESFRRFVDQTIGEVREEYRPFFEGLSADPTIIDSLLRLIAREQLLSTDWISSRTPISHSQSASNARHLQETGALLRGLLSKEDSIALQNYKASLPSRKLLEPIFFRLEAAGIPPRREQVERAVADVHVWGAGLMNRAHEKDVVSCEQVNAALSRREAELLGILSKSLDEQQASVVREHYRQLAEQRVQSYRSACEERREHFRQQRDRIGRGR